jgi:hypothetical protein
MPREQNIESKTLAETIIWMARERMKVEPYQNINSAIHGVMMEMKQPLMEFMAEQKRRGR